MLAHHAQRLGRLAAAVQGQRVLAHGPVTLGMLGREGRQLAGDLRVATERQRRLPALLHHVEAVEAQSLDLGLGRLELGQLAERLTAPQLERLLEQPFGGLRIAALAGCRGLGRAGG